jgi:hypothetical protein
MGTDVCFVGIAGKFSPSCRHTHSTVKGMAMTIETRAASFFPRVISRMVSAVIHLVKSASVKRIDDLDEYARRDIGLKDGRLTRQRMRDHSHDPFFPD